jgi:hypothetical protein
VKFKFALIFTLKSYHKMVEICPKFEDRNLLHVLAEMESIL